LETIASLQTLEPSVIGFFAVFEEQEKEEIQKF
jgi:hypothetical protein